MIKKTIAILCLLGVSAWAEPGDITFDMEGKLDYSVSEKTNDGKTELTRNRIKVKIDATDNIQAVLKAELSAILHDEAGPVNNTYDWEQVLKNAYIRIHSNGSEHFVFGILDEVQAGKIRSSFGTEEEDDFTERAVAENSPLYSLNNGVNDEVMGIRVKLSDKAFARIASVLSGLKVDAAITENPYGKNGAGDMELSEDGLAYAIKVSKTFGNLEAAAALRQIRPDEDGEKDDTLASLSLAYLFKDAEGNMKYKIYGAGYLMDENREFTESDFAYMVGAAMKLGKKMTLALEYTYIDKVQHEIVASAVQQINNNLAVGGEFFAIYDDEAGIEEEFGGAVRLTIKGTVKTNAQEILSLN